MPVTVTLRMVKGEAAGYEKVFTERTTFIIGRDKDCHLTAIENPEPRYISRQHCMLEINPPDIWIRDLGSRSGTYVNQELIGKRKTVQPTKRAGNDWPEHKLKDGDEIRLHHTFFHVSVDLPVICNVCGKEIPDEKASDAALVDGGYQCERCRQLPPTEDRPVSWSQRVRSCSRCGKDISAEWDENRHGEYVCQACKSDPFEVLRGLFDAASSGDEDLLSIDGYSIVKELGRGGMGCVCLAQHDRSREYVAIKVMLPDVAAGQSATEDFLRETENSKALNHKNVAELFEAGCCRGTFFFTSEFCDGGSVADMMNARGGKLPIEEALEITLQALDGLHYAHHAEVPYVKLADGTIGSGRGLVHRDIKPGNIFVKLLGSQRVAKVGDYGLAKAFDFAGMTDRTCTGVVKGTPAFMSRKQAINFKFAQPEVDVWAMAGSLYNMLTGHIPRNFSDEENPWVTVLNHKPIPIRERDASIPQRLAEVIDLALDDSGELHFKTAVDLKQALIDV